MTNLLPSAAVALRRPSPSLTSSLTIPSCLRSGRYKAVAPPITFLSLTLSFSPCACHYEASILGIILMSTVPPAPYITLVDAGLSPPSQPSTPTSLAHGARTHPHIRGVLLPVARHTRGRLKYARRPHPTTNMPSSVFWRSGPPPLARDYSPISHLPPFLLENPPRCLTIASETLARAEGRQPLSPRHTTIYRWRSLRTAGEFPQTATARDSCIPMRGQ